MGIKENILLNLTYKEDQILGLEGFNIIFAKIREI